MKNILPIEKRLTEINGDHPMMSVLLSKIKENIVHSRRFKPWQAIKWKAAKVTAQHVEELGLLVHVEGEGDHGLIYAKEASDLVVDLMNYYENQDLEKELASYYELFLSETALSLIYLLEYFSNLLTRKELKYFHEKLICVADTLWQLILKTKAYNERTQSRLAWNHSQFVHAISGICALKIDNEYSDERLSRVILWMEGYLSHSFTWDGFSREGIFYAGATRMPLLLFCMTLKDSKSIDLLQHKSLMNHSQYLINEWVPNTSGFITRNDINHLGHSTTLSSLLTYSYLYSCEKALLLWEAVVGEKGDKTYGNPSEEANRNGSLVLNYLFYPTDLSPQKKLEDYIQPFKVYREAGVVVAYSKLGNNAYKYSFQASSYYGDIHSQSDHGQIYLYLDGDTLLGDTSVGNSRQADAANQSEGHNALMIDGKGMAISGGGWQTCSILEEVMNHGDYHTISANLAPAYNAYHSRVSVLHYKRLVIVHTTEPYHIIVLDSVRGDQKVDHEYSYRFHTAPNHSISHQNDVVEIQTPKAFLQIIPLGITWEISKQKQFIFNSEARSSYIDCSFSGKEFVGGYVLVPTPEKDRVNITREKQRVIIQSNEFQSDIIFNSSLTNVDAILNTTTFIKNQEPQLQKRITVMKEAKPVSNDFDHLTGVVEYEVVSA